MAAVNCCIFQIYLEESERNTQLKYIVHKEQEHLLKLINIANTLKATSPLFHYNLDPQLVRQLKETTTLTKECSQSFSFTRNTATSEQSLPKQAMIDNTVFTDTNHLHASNAIQQPDFCFNLSTGISASGKGSLQNESAAHTYIIHGQNVSALVESPGLPNVKMANYTAEGVMTFRDPSLEVSRVSATCGNIVSQEHCITNGQQQTTTLAASSTITDLDQLDQLKLLADHITQHSTSTELEPTSSNTQLDEVTSYTSLSQNKIESSLSSNQELIDKDGVYMEQNSQMNVSVTTQNPEIPSMATVCNVETERQPAEQLAIPDWEALTPVQCDDNNQGRQSKRASRLKNSQAIRKKIKTPNSNNIKNNNQCDGASGTEDLLSLVKQNLLMMGSESNDLGQGIMPSKSRLDSNIRIDSENITDLLFMPQSEIVPSSQAIEAIKANLLQGITADMFNNNTNS